MEESKGKNSSPRISRFYVIYFTVTFTMILIVIFMMEIVKDRLAEYEAVQPRYVAEKVFARYFDPINYADLLAEANYNAGQAEFDELVDYLTGEINGEKLTYSIGSSNAQDEVRYIVKAGPKQLAAIVLNVSDKKTEHGFQTYDFSHIDLHLNMETYLEELSKIVVKVEVPATYSVTVDGTPLLPDLITETQPQPGLMKYYPSDVPEIEYAVYTIMDLKALPEQVVVTDPEGTVAEVGFDEDTYTYACGLVYSESMESEYSEFVTNALEGYAAYVQAAEDVSLGDIRGYFDTSSEVYADVVAAGNDRWMVLKCSGIDFEDVNVGEFYVHTPEIFSCRISFTQVMHRTGREDYVDAIDKYLFLHLTDDGYKIYDWYNAS